MHQEVTPTESCTKYRATVLTLNRASAAFPPFWDTKEDRKKTYFCASTLGLAQKAAVTTHSLPRCPEALDLPAQPRLRAGEPTSLLSRLPEIQRRDGARPGLPQPRQLSGPIGSPPHCSDAEFNLPVLTEHPASHPPTSSITAEI